MALTSEEIVREAVALLDDVGLEALTLRALADRLGVKAPTLYWHVADKRTLLDLMAARILADAEPEGLRRPEPGESLWDWVHRRAEASYEALVARRDGPLVLAGNRPSIAALPHIEGILAVFGDHGVAPVEALLALTVVGNYVMGSALEHQAEQRRALEGDLVTDSELATYLRGHVDDFPLLITAMRGVHGVGPHEGFRRGLRMVVAGLAAAPRAGP